MAEIGNWLPQIEVTTTAQDVLTRPSVLNPYPELVDPDKGDGDIRFTPDESIGANLRIWYMRVGKSALVRIPDKHEVPEPESRPELHDGSMPADDELPNGYWSSFSQFWHDESVALATRYIVEKASPDAIATLGDLILAHEHYRLGDEEDEGRGKIYPEPQPVIAEAFDAMEQAMQDKKPELAFALSELLFEGVTYKCGGLYVSMYPIEEWRDNGLAQTIFDRFASSLATVRHGERTIVTPWGIGADTAKLATAGVGHRAVAAWILANGKAPEPVLEKASLLKAQRGEDVAEARGSLSMRLDEATYHFSEVGIDAWDLPRNYESFIRAKLKSFVGR